MNGCCVPSNILAPRPRNESSSVRSFAVISDQAWWFLRWCRSRRSGEQLSLSIAYKPARGGLLNLPSHRSGIGVGAQSSSPSRSPTATRTASLLRPNPHEATGIVRSQSPECGDDTAPSLAWLSGSLLDDHTAAFNTTTMTSTIITTTTTSTITTRPMQYCLKYFQTVFQLQNTF